MLESKGFWLGLEGLLAGALDGLMPPFLFGPGFVYERVVVMGCFYTFSAFDGRLLLTILNNQISKLYFIGPFLKEFSIFLEGCWCGSDLTGTDC